MAIDEQAQITGGPRGDLTVKRSDLAIWKARGYRLCESSEADELAMPPDMQSESADEPSTDE
jgi:hypothetical protein